MKIFVYAICKNEEKFCERWYNSVKEADGVYVLDTGSSDGTVEALKALGAVVHREIISPWRFDKARNRSLEFVPRDADVCVCCDLDEIFEPGWRNEIEKRWKKGVKQASYRYTWSFDEYGREGYVFYIEKIHAREGFRWVHPVHEVLEYFGNEPFLTVRLPIQLNHYPDNTKSRSSYLPLLELSVAEQPEDDRNMHYLGREYMFKGMWEKSIETLKRHLSLKSATWADERCASMRFIANDYLKLGKPYEALRWLYRAVAEAPHLREPYIDTASLLYSFKNYRGAAFFCLEALKIETRPVSYICEPKSWNEYPYDLLSFCLFMTGDYSSAVTYAEYALEKKPDDERLKNNLEIFRKKATASDNAEQKMK